MVALIRHELRRLLPLALALLASAALFGGMDVALNARRAQFRGISYYYCLMLAVLVSFGAAYFARTGRSFESRFLGLWPVSRLRLALVRTPLYLVLGALTVVFSFVICGAVLRLGGHDPWNILFDDVLFEPYFLPVGVAALALLFSLTLLWSQVLETVLAVPLVLVTGAGLVGGLVWLVAVWLPPSFGPWLSPVVVEGLQSAGFPVVTAWTAAVLAVLALLAAILGAVRAPLLETKRRAGVSIGALGVMLVLLAGASLPVAFPLTKPRLTKLAELTYWEAGEFWGAGVGLDDSRRWALLQTGDRPEVGLWAIDLQSGRRRLIARGPTDDLRFTGPDGRAAFSLYSRNWLADLDTGRLLRLPGEGHMPASLSPSGRYLLRYDPRGQLVIGGGPTDIPLGLNRYLLGWQGDEAAYVISDGRTKDVSRISLPDGAERVIARDVPIMPWIRGLSPTGKWLVGEVLRKRPADGPGVGLVSTATGQFRASSGRSTGVWSADDRFLWVYARDPLSAQRRSVPPTFPEPANRRSHLRLLDTQTMTFVRTIDSAQLGGEMPSIPYADPQHRRLVFRSRPLDKPGYTYWTADITGGDLRKIGDIRAALWGVAGDGSLVMMDNTSLFLVNPQTLTRRVLVQVEGK